MPKKKTGMTGGKDRVKNTSHPWVKAVRLSGREHGSGILQKKLWRLVSDFVRIRDWYKYGTCVATGKRVDHWREGHAGHFRPYSVCRGMFKFDERNIFLQGAKSNNWGGYDDWIAFEDEVVRRTNHDKESIDRINLSYELKINDSLVLEKMKDILVKMKDLPEKPDYYERVMEKFAEYKV